VKNLLAVLFSLCPAMAAAWPSPVVAAAQTPHPAVVRVVVADRDGATSKGTGALVAVDDAHGLVVTNWHVVRDAAVPTADVVGPITVVFPNGFRSGGLLLKADHDWDLAALAIQRPPVQPLPLATEPPRPGEPLSITGYGPDGTYRTATGRCVKYYSPRENFPLELLEVDVEARSGDSGGPICNSRGEIAGILFGAGGNLWSGGYTVGSYCGRVRLFLEAAYVDFQRLPGNTTMIAQAPAPTAVANPQRRDVRETPNYTAEAAAPGAPSRPVAMTGPFAPPAASGGPVVNRPSSPAAVPASSSPVAQVLPVTAASQSEPLPSPIDQIKNILAVIGIVAILFHGLRLVGSTVA
jgi:hypothetical protein